MKIVNRDGTPSLDEYIKYVLKENRENENLKKTIKDIVSSGINSIFKSKETSERKPTIRIDNYYTEEYKEYKKSPSKEETKYYKVLKAQRAKSMDPFLILGLEEAASLLLEHIEVYYEAYVLPKCRMESHEWDFLFDTVFDLLKEKEITNLYYNLMGLFIRYTLAKTLVSHSLSLSLCDFADNIDKLVDAISYYSPVKLNKKEVEALRVKLINGTTVGTIPKDKNNNNIINFENYQKNKRLR